jgi:hypothetical protein
MFVVERKLRTYLARNWNEVEQDAGEGANNDIFGMRVEQN